MEVRYIKVFDKQSSHITDEAYQCQVEISLYLHYTGDLKSGICGNRPKDNKGASGVISVNVVCVFTLSARGGRQWFCIAVLMKMSCNYIDHVLNTVIS